jgi:hypothetical protein
MDKQVFDDVIGEVPPSTVDVEAVITRGRRADRLRWATNPAAVAGLAVVLLSGAVAFTMSGGDDSGGVGVATTSSSTWPPTDCPQTALELPEEVKAHLDAAAKAAVQEQRPDLQLTANPIVRFPETTNNHGPLEFHLSNELYPRGDNGNCLDLRSNVALAKTKGPEGDGTILISIAPDVYDVPDCAQPVHTQTFCEQVTGPNGETIVKRTTEFRDSGSIKYDVNIDKPDGTEVAVVVENVPAAVQDGPPPTRTAPPLNYDQMIAIALDPGLTLYP